MAGPVLQQIAMIINFQKYSKTSKIPRILRTNVQQKIFNIRIRIRIPKGLEFGFVAPKELEIIKKIIHVFRAKIILLSEVSNYIISIWDA